MVHAVSLLIVSLAAVARAEEFVGSGQLLVNLITGVNTWGPQLGCLTDKFLFTADTTRCGIFNGTIEIVPPHVGCDPKLGEICKDKTYWHYTSAAGVCSAVFTTGLGSKYEYGADILNCGDPVGDGRFTVFYGAQESPPHDVLSTYDGNRFTTLNGSYPSGSTDVKLILNVQNEDPKLDLTWAAL